MIQLLKRIFLTEQKGTEIAGVDNEKINYQLQARFGLPRNIHLEQIDGQMYVVMTLDNGSCYTMPVHDKCVILNGVVR